MADPQPERTSLYDQALAYRARGWPVFPVCTARSKLRCEQHGDCKNPGKAPLVRWQQYQTRVPSEHEVRQWWRKWPTANIGMATGALSGVVVLDTDSGDARMDATQRGGIDHTLAVWTGKPGGCHFWLTHPGKPVHNFAGELPGLDFRGDGGYVLLPPSIHATGARYRWVEGTTALSPQPVPPWLDDLLEGRSNDSQATAERAPLDLEHVWSGVPEGARDSTLYSFACKMRADDVPIAYAVLLMREAAGRCRPPFEVAVALDQLRRAYKDFTPNLSLDDVGDFPGTRRDDPFADDATEPWAVYDAGTFLARQLPAIQWEIDGFVRQGGICWVYGAPGALKTYLATEAALAVSSGTPFLGRFHTVAGKVLVVQEDTLETDYQQVYLRPMLAARDLDAMTLETLSTNLYIAPPAGMRLDDGARLRELVAWLEAERPALIVLDAFYLFYAGEGYGKELRRMVTVLRELRTRYGSSIWIVDHDRKGGQEGRDKENPIDRLIGGREKSAGADAVLELVAVKGVPGLVQLHTHKVRGAKPCEPLTIRLHDGQLALEEGPTAQHAGTTEQVYQWLIHEGGSRTKKQMETGTSLAARTVDYAIGELFSEGRVRQAGKAGKAVTWLGLRTADQVVPW